jgi:hypothetical protein
MGGMKLGLFGGLAFFVLTIVFTNIAIDNNRAVRAVQDQMFGIGQYKIKNEQNDMEVRESEHKDQNQTQVTKEKEQFDNTSLSKFNQQFDKFEKKFNNIF